MFEALERCVAMAETNWSTPDHHDSDVMQARKEIAAARELAAVAYRLLGAPINKVLSIELCDEFVRAVHRCEKLHIEAPRS